MRKEREIQEWFSILIFVCHFGRETAIYFKDLIYFDIYVHLVIEKAET